MRRITRATVVMALLLVPFICLHSATCDESNPNPLLMKLRQILNEQAAAWNRADIDGFMEHYWKSDQLTFCSGGKTTKGWLPTKAGYERRYPTVDKMGRVKFSNLEATPLGDAAALVLGRWHLQRKDEALEGNFSLIFRRIDDRWVIVHDHTSLLKPPATKEAPAKEAPTE